MKLSGIKVLENEGGAVPNRTQRPQSETIAVKDYVGNGRRWSEGGSTTSQRTVPHGCGLV